LCERMVSAQLGIVDEELFRNALITVKNSDQIPLAGLARTIVLEAWLRHLCHQPLLTPTFRFEQGARHYCSLAA
jgi:hypothetical protein